MPYAWQRRGQLAEELLAERGAGGGYSILGFWRSSDPQPTGRQAFTAELFVAAVMELLVDRQTPNVLVLNNASIHKAQLVQQHVADWAAQGLTLLFRSPYSPEVNCIKILWRFCKHYWLTPAAYQASDTLLWAVT